MHWNRWNRRLHRWGAIVTLVPLLIVIVSGLLLQVKKQVAWIQPPTQRGVGGSPSVTWAAILATAQGIPEAEVSDWPDIDRLDVQPGRGIVKLRCQNSWELQLDLVTGEVLSSQRRRSDLIETIHDGSWFHDQAKLWVFLPNGLILLGLWCTGLYLWLLPHWAKRKNRARREQLKA